MSSGDTANPRSSRGDEAGPSKPGLLTSAATPATDDAPPGVPGFRSWRGVYVFVLVWFAACVLGLTLLTRFT